MSLSVWQQSPAIEAMSEEWDIAESLLGGTKAMRAKGLLYLPQWPAEDDDAYASRLAVATLFPAYRRTVSVMTGKPFSQPPTLSEETPSQIREWSDDIDMMGSNLHAFSAQLFEESLAFALAGVLVDYPRTEGAAQTQADERAMGARPYWIHIKHDQILGWRTEWLGGQEVLTQLRIREIREEDDGEYGVVSTEYVRVLYRGGGKLYKIGDAQSRGKSSATLVEEWITSLKEIPFAPFYGRKKSFMCGMSPLTDLAYLNVKHWQSQSDQDTILHVARVPILAMIGADPETTLTVGGSTAIKLPQGADIKFAEHSGAAINAGKESLEDLEQQMIQTGAELLVAKPGDRTATEAANDAEANKSDLQRITEDFEDSLNLALYFTAQFANLPQSGTVSLYKDFSAFSLSEASAQIIIELQQGGLISRQTALREQQRRSIISPDIDIEEELEAVEAEGPALSDVG